MLRRVCSVGLAALGLMLAPRVILADPPPPVVNTTFETDPGDWRAMSMTGQPSDTAKLTITHAAANVKEGKGSLEYSYRVDPVDISFLLLPLQPPSLVKANSIHFWIKLDHNASVMLIVGEKEGGRYQQIFACPANTWQEVSIGFGDLVLNQDADSPKDPDNKLDADQIESVALIDADCFLAHVPNLAPLLNIAAGDHKLYLNSFTVDETTLPASGAMELSPLLRPQADWLVFGDIQLQKVNEKPLTGPSIRASYTQKKAKVYGLIKPVKVGSLADAKQLKFNLASSSPAKLIVQVEEINGNKFNTIIDAPGASEAKDYSLAFADFKPADDTKDPAAHLQLQLVKQLVFVDATGMGDIQDTENKLWINNLKLSK